MSFEPGGHHHAARTGRSPWIVAGAIFGLSVLLRSLVALRIAAIFNDGPHFILMARLMAEGRWADAVSHPYHPLYPLAICGVHRLVGDWETAATFVSIVAGGISVVALYFFLRGAFDETTAWIGALLIE